MTGAASSGVPADVSAVPAPEMPQVTYISWAESCSRSDHTARELGGRSHMVYRAQYGSKASTILLKYLSQWRATARILRDEHPDVVFVMTPPLFAALPAFLHAWRRGGQVVLDAHSAAFLHPRWRFLQWLQRWLCRRAATTLVHNAHIAELVRGMGARVTLVPDVPVIYERIEPFDKTAFTVVAVCSFNYDEPIAEMIAAAALVPDVRVLMTGNPKHLPADLKGRLPANVTLTGFVSTETFGGLLTGADAVMTLTTRDHTMLRGAYEAIYQGTPVIVSDWQILRDYFAEGAVHVNNTADGIAAAIRRLQQQPEHFRDGARRLRDLKLETWRQTRQAILAAIGRPSRRPAVSSHS